MSIGSSIEVRVERRKSPGEMKSEKASQRADISAALKGEKDVFIQQEYSPGRGKGWRSTPHF